MLHFFQQNNEVKHLWHYVSLEKIYQCIICKIYHKYKMYQCLEVIWCLCSVWLSLIFCDIDTEQMHWPRTLPQFLAWKWYFLGETEMSKQLIGIICKPFVKLFGSLWICVDENRCNWRVQCFVWVVLKNEIKCIWQNHISRETRICFSFH